MNELKRLQQMSGKERERMELLSRMTEAERVAALEAEQKQLLRQRNNELLTECMTEQERVQALARQAKLSEDQAFQEKLRLMKEQEMIAKQKDKEYKDMMIKDLHDNYDIQKKVNYFSIVEFRNWSQF